ncbi:MAG: hypothetical protein RLY31_1394 [Bacteroidota bacterium]|jgi:predicted dehydrogenase
MAISWLLCQLWILSAGAQDDPLRLGVIGLTHSHVHWVFTTEAKSAFELVGIVEPDTALAGRYARQYGYPMDRVYPTTEALLAAEQPQAVAAFGNIRDHLAIVETCAPKGIHVMVEKPLALHLDDARKMEALARRHGIHLLTNYETTWYPTHQQAFELVRREGAIGDIRKVVVRDGHRGPKNIGVPAEFLAWLTDPARNGGGAIMDFGCYGANFLTWLMDGRKPLQVTAVTRQLQAENNPLVDDEAVIILSYPDAIAILQPSWNWPIGRKDLEIYGLTGVVYADNRHDLRIRQAEGYDGFSEERLRLPDRPAPFNDPFAYFAAVVKGEVLPTTFDLSSLENNMVVMEILDAAIRSAESGQAVRLSD